MSAANAKRQPAPRRRVEFVEWFAVGWLLAGFLAAPIAWFVARGGRRERIRWAAFGLLLPPSVLWVIARRLRPEEPREDAWVRAAPRPVARVEASDLGSLPEPVTACPDCGFIGIRPPGVQDGVWPGGGELIEQVCPRCGFRGLPMQFATREEYAEFVAQLARGV